MRKSIKKMSAMLAVEMLLCSAPCSYIASCELKGCSAKRVERPQVETSQLDLHPLDMLSLRLMN